MPQIDRKGLRRLITRREERLAAAPQPTEADSDRHTDVFRQTVAPLERA